MASDEPVPSARRTELLERAYSYALEHGLAELSLRPLATAIGSTRARSEELALLDQLRDLTGEQPIGLEMAATQLWSWLAAPEHRPLLTLWVEGYSRSLLDADGPWGGFASSTVNDWLALLAETQPPEERDTDIALQRRTLVLAVLRGALLDLLATGDTARTTTAVHAQLAALPHTSTREPTFRE
jgi:hypothetical protein